MLKLKAVTAAILAFGMLLTGAPANADPGDYWLDVCNDTGVDTIIYEEFRYEVTCSSDPWVQGYNGTGIEAYALIQVRVYDPSGRQVAEFNDGLRATGASFAPGTNSPADWVGVDYDIVMVDAVDGDEVCVSGFCNPDLPGVPVVLVRDAWVDSDEQILRIKRDGHENWVLVDVCTYPVPTSSGGCEGEPIETDLLP